MSAPDERELRAVVNPRRSGGRAPKRQTLVGRGIAVRGKPVERRSSSSRKAELMDAARRAGWRGRSYRTAKKFERALERHTKEIQ
ncbi:MAG: hypothetical protein ACREBE_29820 [bacterium]